MKKPELQVLSAKAALASVVDGATLVAWVREHVPPATDASEPDRVRWFVAYHLASEYVDANSTKDWASMLLEGVPPVDADPIAAADDWLALPDEDDEYRSERLEYARQCLSDWWAK